MTESTGSGGSRYLRNTHVVSDEKLLVLFFRLSVGDVRYDVIAVYCMMLLSHTAVHMSNSFNLS